MIVIDKKVLNEFKIEADKTNKEVCGFITTDNQDNCKLHMIENIVKENNIDYLMNPDQAFAILKDTQFLKNADEAKYELLAIIHSHPNWDCRPSDIDIREAKYNVSYIIYSKPYKCFKSWLIHDNEYTTEEEIAF